MIKIALLCMLTGSLLFFGGVPAVAASSSDFTIGTAAVTAFQDARGEFPLSLFKGADVAELEKAAPSGKLPSTVNVFLVRNNGKIILVDTGNGPDGKGAFENLLEGAGIQPRAVDAVLLTHMHGDHIGGLLRNGKAFFPKAEILVSEPERAFWAGEAAKGAQSAYAGNAGMAAKVFAAYGNRVRAFAFGGTVLPGIEAMATTGHTPGHTAFLLTSGDERLLFWGDLVHAAALQFANPDICATYDMNMEQARITRKEAMLRAAGDTIPVAGAHLPFPGIGRVRKGDGGGFAFLPGLN